MCRRVLENQHKLCTFLQQQNRLCSGGSARVKEVQKFDEDGGGDMFKTNQYQPMKSPLTQIVEHAPDNGQLFKVSLFKLKFEI